MSSAVKNKRVDDQGDVHWKCKCGALFKSEAAIRQHRAKYKATKCAECDFRDPDIRKVNQHQAIAGHRDYDVWVDPRHE